MSKRQKKALKKLKIRSKRRHKLLGKPSRESFVKSKPVFVDLFAGCGGLSLGLLKAGWQGFFAVERTKDAFETMRYNLIDGPHAKEHKFSWPREIKQENIDIIEFLSCRKNKIQLEQYGLLGAVDLIAGGPPCQGFSWAGRRNEDDPRNKLFEHYVEFVSLVKPTFLLMENVKGIGIPFNKNGSILKASMPKPKSHAEEIVHRLQGMGYVSIWFEVLSSSYGVPQWRPRFIMIGVKAERFIDGEAGANNFLGKIIETLGSPARIQEFWEKNGLDYDKKQVSVGDAISDFEICEEIEWDPEIDGIDQKNFRGAKFLRLSYLNAKPITNYQRLMHKGINGEIKTNLRLARHSDEIKDRFSRMLQNGRRAVNLSGKDKEDLKIALKKHTMVILDPSKPSHTLTTLPDDLLHYSKPRILTVREYARLQSFPDWFDFRGKYTTGGNRRKEECPRYTQVGNAVPPLMAEFIGEVFLEKAHEHRLLNKLIS